MRTKGMLCSLLLILLLPLAAAPAPVFAESAGESENTGTSKGSRNIYVGDIITLNISAEGFSEEDLRQKFAAFEIVELKTENDGYLLSLRTFEPGKHTILLGDKEIVIEVASTLDDMKREDIFEGDAGVMLPGFSVSRRLLFYAAAGIFVLTGSFILGKLLLKRNKKEPEPYQLFLRRSEALSVEDDNYFVDLTYYFKEYIESLHKCRIIGKTSREMTEELKAIPDLNSLLPEIQDWMLHCDNLKFSGVAVSIEEKQECYQELHHLVKKIDSQNKGVA